MKTKADLTAGNVIERLISFSLPFLFSSFMQAFYGAVDMWTVGHFSTTTNLAAVNTGAQVTQIVTGFCVGISMGTTVLIGHCVGAILRGDGNSQMPMVFVGIACLVNVIGDLILTGYMGFGVIGVAVATVFAQAVSSVIGIVCLCKKGLSFPITKRIRTVSRQYEKSNIYRTSDCSTGHVN